MLNRLFCRRLFVMLAIVWVLLLLPSYPAEAAIDPFVARILHVTEPIALDFDGKGDRSFSPAELSQGKKLFQDSCIGCHVGGSTLPDPLVSLSLDKLKGANPPRDNISSLVAFLRQPMTYDGSEESYNCRQVPESWMQREEVEKLAAFILTAAQKAPGWGTETF